MRRSTSAFALLVIPAALLAQEPRCPRAAGDTAPVTPSDVDRPPIADSANGPPGYPDLLRQAGIGGTVRVTFTVDTAGRVEGASVRIVRTPNAAFDAFVKRAVAAWRYTPAALCGHHVRVRLSHEFAFQVSPTPKDTLRWSELFEVDTGVTQAVDTLPDGTLRTKVGWWWTPVAASPNSWEPAALDSAEEAAIGALVDRVGPARSGMTRVVCLVGRGGVKADPDSARLARLTRPRIAILPFRRCPPSFDSMIYRPDEPPHPPGEDPFRLDVRTRSPISATRVVFNIDVAQGTGGHHYRCGVERRDSGWRVRCILTSSWVS